MNYNKKDCSHIGFGGILCICLTVIIVCTGFLFKDKIKSLGSEQFQSENVSNDLTIEQPTVEMKILQRTDEIELQRLNEVYYTLPITIVQKIYEDKGVELSKYDVARVYEKNAEYYISYDISTQLSPTLSGPDANNVKKLEIRTTIEKPTNNKPILLLTPGDSISE